MAVIRTLATRIGDSMTPGLCLFRTRDVRVAVVLRVYRRNRWLAQALGARLLRATTTQRQRNNDTARRDCQHAHESVTSFTSVR